MTQTEKILMALRNGERLTPLDALKRFGCLRLGARIHDLKRLGYPIVSERVLVGNGKVVAQYRMIRLRKRAGRAAA